MRRAAAIAALAFLSASPLSAQTYYFSGTIGKAPVFASLSRDGTNLIGSYLYLKYGKDIELEGKIDASGKFHLDESSFDTTKTSGSFDGTAEHGLWSGTWRNAAGGASLPFVLMENRDTLAGFTGDFRCSETHTDKQYGYVYTRSAHVSISKGVVTAPISCRNPKARMATRRVVISASAISGRFRAMAESCCARKAIIRTTRPAARSIAPCASSAMPDFSTSRPAIFRKPATTAKARATTSCSAAPAPIGAIS